jgi:hypothetical protein
MERAAMFFRFYVEHGQLTIEIGENEIEVRFRDCRGVRRNALPRSHGRGGGFAFAAGGRTALEHVSGGKDGDTHLTVRLRWR